MELCCSSCVKTAPLPADESLVLDRDVEIQLEVRPVFDSGLLMHAETSADLQLSVILVEGKVG